jgi:hypothetical protein
VSRAEVQTAAALTAHVQLWFDRMRDEIFNCPTGEFNLAVISVSNDATTGNIWQKRKLNTMILSGAFLTHLPSTDDFVWDWNDLFAEIMCVCDVQQVDGGSGVDALGMFIKQRASVRCPVFDEVNRQHVATLPTYTQTTTSPYQPRMCRRVLLQPPLYIDEHVHFVV